MTTGFVILLIVVGVLALAAWPVCVLMARRKNREESEARLVDRGERLRADWAATEPQPQYPSGSVVGGLHVGGGRSVAPRRDEKVTPLTGDVEAEARQAE
jgi:hypothetical protein